MRVGILILPFLVLGCNGEEITPALANVVTTTTTTSTTTTTIVKNLFSQWDQNQAPSKRLPFTGRSYNLMFRDTIFLIDNGTQCIVDILITPNPGGGITFSAPSGTGCAGIADTYTWSNVNGTLSLTSSGSLVTTYR